MSVAQSNAGILRVGVLGSGKGSNLQAILDAVSAGRIQAQVVCVISDVSDALILERARKAGVPAFYLGGAPYQTKLDGDAERGYISLLREHGVELVALAGFMRIIKNGMLSAFPGRIINIHPSLLPAFPGLCAWKQALDFGAKVTGCTVHFVDAGMDSGPIILQKTVPVLPQDTPETVHARIQVEEHAAYPEAIQLIAAGRVRVEGRRALIQPRA